MTSIYIYFKISKYLNFTFDKYSGKTLRPIIFWKIEQAVSEEKIFLTLANQKKELILAAMFVGRMEPN
jgi:hypothetical protein